MVPPAEKVPVVPTFEYEPARAKPVQPNPITTVDFRGGEILPTGLPKVDLQTSAASNTFRFWARSEYLNWRVTSAPIAAPLVTTGPANTIGALNEPTTQILFGAGSGQDATFGRLSGARLTIGGWLEEDNEYSWEINGFALARRNSAFSATSGAAATPIVSIPFNATEPFNQVNPAGETSLNAGGAPSSATVQFTSQLWGAEANETVYLWTTERFYWTCLFGFRYVGMNEGLTLTHTSLDATNNGTLAVTDRFSTTNHFYAGQLGTRIGLSLDRWNFDAAGKVAFGSNYQTINIDGDTTVANGGFGFANGTTTGGVFAQSSNIGQTNRGVFMVASEVQVKAAYAVTTRVRAYVGYNALYLSNVVRPGNQIDRNVNPTQNAFFVPPGTLTGAAAPLATVRESSFWAHGLLIGMEVRY